VLAAWSVFGILAVVEGHRRAGRRHAAQHRIDLFAESPLHDELLRDSHLADMGDRIDSVHVTFRGPDGGILPEARPSPS
jgi:hypothetical protein